MASLNRTLLVVCPEGSTLRVFTCVARVRGWSVGRDEIVPLASQPAPQPEAVAAALRPLVLRWGIPPGTEVALVLPAVVGGMLSLAAGTDPADRTRIDTELAGRIPFASRDIECEVRPAGPDRSIQVAWLPRSAAIEFRTSFARLGLALGEIVFRAQLCAHEARGANVADRELVIEQWNGCCSFHLLAHGRVLRTSTVQIPGAREFADRLQLELLSLGATGPSPALSRIVLGGAPGQFSREFEAAAKDAVRAVEIVRRPAELSAMFLRFWRDGETGIWLVPENPPAMVRRLAFAIAGIGALLAAAMAWQVSEIKDETAALEARAARLRPQYQALAARERQALAAAATADAVARIPSTTSEPQAALLAVFNALPRSAWVTRFAFEAGKGTVAGRGLDTESVIAKLKDQPGVDRVTGADKPGSTDGDTASRFRVSFHWAPGRTNERRPH